MITIFNRREVYATFSMDVQARVREILSANGIDYSFSVKNRMSPSPMAAGSRGRMGTAGQSMNVMYEYTFFVRKRDYEQASYLLRTIQKEG